MKFKLFTEAMEYAIKNGYNYFVQVYFDIDEYMGNISKEEYDVKKLKDCDYHFFYSKQEAENFRLSHIMNVIAGYHKWTIDIPKFIEYYEKKENREPEIEALISLYKEIKGRSRRVSDDLPF